MHARLLLEACAASLAALALAAGTPARSAEALKEPKLTGCLVMLKSDAELNIPAQDAGVLDSLVVSEGSEVQKGYPLGKIDDTEPQMQKLVAELQRQAAETEAANDISVRYAKAAEQVAEATVLERRAANRKVPGTVTAEELRRLVLDHRRAQLSIEQSQLEQDLAVITAKSKAAEVETAEKKIERHKIRAPISGQVVSVFRQVGEWVSPGDPIVRIINLETLRIDGVLNASDYDPWEVNGRPVTVQVELARGRSVQLPGRVTYVSPEVQTGGDYPVWAEVTNRKENGQWLLRPGLIASMTIHVHSATDAGKLPAESKGSARSSESSSKPSHR